MKRFLLFTLIFLASHVLNRGMDFRQPVFWMWHWLGWEGELLRVGGTFAVWVFCYAVYAAYKQGESKVSE